MTDIYKCEECGKIFDEFEMNFKATQEDKKTLCRKCRKKELLHNEVIHQLMGVDGWQEIYADAPSEEDIRKEMTEDIEKEKEG